MAVGDPRNGPSGRRREATDLYATVLEVVKRYHGAARITRVSYGAGMPVDRLRAFLDRLLALGLLRSEELDGRPVFDITPRGQEFLDTYWKMRAYVEILGPANERRRARRPSSGPAPDPDEPA
jgi:predicted transcriptional regulator